MTDAGRATPAASLGVMRHDDGKPPAGDGAADQLTSFQLLFQAAPLIGVLCRVVRDAAGDVTELKVAGVNAFAQAHLESAEVKRRWAADERGMIGSLLGVCQEAMARRESVTVERMVGPGGDAYRVTAIPVGPEHVVSLVVNVAEQGRAQDALAIREAELRESRDLLAAVIESSVDAIYAKDRAGRYVLANPAVFTYTGVEAADLLGKDDATLFSPVDAAAIQAADRRVLETGTALTYEESIRAADGTNHWLLSTKAPLRAADGSVIGLLGVSRDISETRETMAALQASEDRYHGLVEGLDAVVSVQDAVLGQFYLSPQCGAMFGFSAQVMADPSFWRSRVVDEDRERVFAVWDDRSGGDAYELQYRMRRADGVVIWVEDRQRAARGNDGRVLRWHGVILDVTERHRLAGAEKERDALQKRLGQMVQLARDVVLLIDGTGRIVEANDAAVKAYGHDHDALCRMSIADLRDPASRGDLGAQFAAAARPQGVLFESVHIRSDGTTFPVEVSSHKIEMDGVPHWQSVVRDITDRHKAERALRASEAMATAVIQGTADAVYVKDPDGRILFANESAARLFGRGANTMIGHDAADWMSPEQARATAAIERQVLGTMMALSAEGSMTALGGQSRWYHTTTSPLAASDGAFLGLLVVARDITDRKRMEESLRVSDALQRGVFEALAEGVLVYGASGRIVSANRRAVEILGIGRAEMGRREIDSNDWPVSGEDGLPVARKDLPASVTLRTGEAVQGATLCLATPDGRSVWLRLNTVAQFDEAGVVSGVVASFADITEQRDLEARLRQAHRLEAVGQLAGGVAHDFNNLLAAIIGFTELVKGALPADSVTLHDIEEALRAAERAAALTRQLLAFSRRQALRPQVVDPAVVIGNLVPMLERLLGEHIAVTMSSTIAPGYVEVDPGQLEQVIVNLSVNARDAMPDGGRLAIVLADAEVASGDGLTWPAVEIAVRDTGTGMDATTAAKVFEPFYSTKGPGKGSGMGLATVHGIVAQSGGQISVVSQVGVGTVFTIHLPKVAPPPLATSEMEAPTVSSAGSETVLLVEDEPSVRTVTTRLLRSLGYAVVEADGAASALALDDTVLGSVSLLLTDVVMPGMSGVRLAEALALRHPGVPVVLMSGFAPEDAVSEGIAEPGAAFLSKPFTRDQLASAIRQTLDRAPTSLRVR